MKISAVILAGGQGRRLGREDKGLVLLHGHPLIARVLDRITPQVDEILISANRNIETYAGLGYPVLADGIGNFAGPLAGLHRTMTEATHPLVLAVPCDTPFLPDHLAARLLTSLRDEDADIAIPFAGGRTHQAVCLCRRTILMDLDQYLRQGGRRVDEWQCRHQRIEVLFDNPDAFANINTPEELALAEQRLGN
ncbi:molybdenum cofactor guanylyltransferase [Sulfuriferula sp. AH1]|uniref:molybdenum cofactor guanylyltransferase MobA n=1 Tax=Sulfuriferula sp. AH1 TaxID=1985873 RepID=UPI000B3BA4A3|nr:molybdenum cofactor guanylyltransferase MobA [Sulfuriferula sp. AH1]ARU31820.1 molybdenum cofactor guanylyltransferase [Sulfuriferula sp. AH1]